MKPRPELQPRGRLSRSAEFERVYRQGRSTANRHLVLYTFPNPPPSGRGSGCRCRARSAARSSATGSSACCARRSRSAEAELAPGQDVVVVARPAARELAEREGLDGRGCVARGADRQGGSARAASAAPEETPRERGRVTAPGAARSPGRAARAARAASSRRRSWSTSADLTGDPAPLQVRAHVLALCGRGDPASTAYLGAWCSPGGAC